MRLVVGVIGVIMCLASVVLLGHDVAVYLAGDVIVNSRTHQTTQVLDVMRRWMPELWTQTVNFINTEALYNFWARAADYAVATPVWLVGLLFGMVLVIIGFRIRRYHPY